MPQVNEAIASARERLRGAIYAHPTKGIVALDNADAETLREIIALIWTSALEEKRELIRERDSWMDLR